MNISCIILNYNDPETTISLVTTIVNYKILDSIVIVDNCSTDDSVSRLQAVAGGKVHLISTEKNGGYGYGNNQGIRYAYGTLHASHVLIANPDVKVTEGCIQAMKDSFLKISRLGVAAAVTRDGAGEVALSSWRINGLMGDLLDTGLITRRIFARWLNDRPELKADLEKERYVYVDAVL
ncbi:MAG TPA: glycosyltransferase family 2 protein, partial [Lachnoclostridium sp.]|nr:glycosyltransferase family 2 protein [Lachnoclostridium sp.]